MRGFEVKALSAGYGGRRVIDGLSFSVGSGRLMGVLGANGSGKTTLLRSICGIVPHSGECLLDGQRLEGLSPRKIAAKCGYIPQRSGISIDISALDVALMGFNPRLGLLERPGIAMRERAREALETVGLGGKEDENYQHLSEGQKQLCVLARTLVSDCGLLLMDEPESALDFRFRYRLLELVGDRIKSSGGMGLVALHDPALALNCCDELLLLNEGRIAGILRPAEDEIGHMEALLSTIYGTLSLACLNDRTGRKHIVMLREKEE